MELNNVDMEDNELIQGGKDLIGLIDDCKEKILLSLNLVDLLNIADSSKEMHPMACDVFKSKYGNRRITIDFEIGNKNCITSPLVTLKLLRNFGHLISDLQINFALFNVDLCAKIEQYLTRFCSKSLSFVSIRCHPQKELFENIDEPFANVFSIEMERCCFFSNKIAYNEYFPGLRFIQIDSNRYEIRSYINTHFPYLQSLAALKDSDEREIISALKLNPQIEKLLLITNYNERLIRSLNSLPRLKCLCLRDLPREFKYYYFDPVHLEHILDFSVSSGPETLEQLPFTFCKLEHLSIAGRLKLDTKWVNLIRSMDSLKSIALFDVSGNVDELLDFPKAQKFTAEFLVIDPRILANMS